MVEILSYNPAYLKSNLKVLNMKTPRPFLSSRRLYQKYLITRPSTLFKPPWSIIARQEGGGGGYPRHNIYSTIHSLHINENSLTNWIMKKTQNLLSKIHVQTR